VAAFVHPRTPLISSGIDSARVGPGMSNHQARDRLEMLESLRSASGLSWVSWGVATVVGPTFGGEGVCRKSREALARRHQGQESHACEKCFHWPTVLTGV
jgi:hypothetical protein